MPSTGAEIIGRRMHNQRLGRSRCRSAAELVQWMGAVQAQEYAPARWGVGLRTRGMTDEAVARAFDEGAILRTHVMRPTWHFVAPADIRWMQALTAARVQRVSSYYRRLAGLDDRALSRSRRTIERALRGGRHLTRAAIATALRRAGIEADGSRLAHLMMDAELHGLVCSGPRSGKQFTYALVDELVPPAPVPMRDEALANLALRYFTSHGPATIRDYAWWSGLTVRDARAGIAMSRPALLDETVDGRTYWFADGGTTSRVRSPAVHLLPIYDEFGIAYRDRDVVPAVPHPAGTRPDGYAHLLVVDGQLVGRWTRRDSPGTVSVEARPFRRLAGAERIALEEEVERYGRFLGMSVTLTLR